MDALLVVVGESFSPSMQGTVYDERLSILKNDLSAEYLRRFQLPGLLTLDAFFRALVTVERENDAEDDPDE